MSKLTKTYSEVCAIFVCFYPELELFSTAVQALSAQVGRVVIVNNGASTEVNQWLANNSYIVLSMSENIGIAAAHNKGIDWAVANEFKYAILMDQDSVATLDMIETLVKSANQLELEGIKFSAIGPKIVSMITGEEHPIIALGFFKNSKKYDDTMSLVMEVDILISSGTMIPLRVIHNVGNMNEGLFIDNVDLEWCFRAKYKGYKLFLEPNAVLKHNLGDSIKNIWFFGNRAIILHKPIRLYYMMRNRIVLYTLVHTPIIWILQDFYRVISKFLIFSLLISPRKNNIRMMLKGLLDGVRGKKGKFLN